MTRILPDNLCIACAHAEIPQGGVMICVNETRVLSTMHARSDSGDCGPEGTMFKQKQREVQYAAQD